MKHDLILAGVGGQGILTIAKGISGAALRRGLHVKQAEVHGMSQRGGSVQSHLRISSAEILSDLIGHGKADLLIAVEPLEALRYLQFLHHDGAIACSVNAFVNIGNYPAVEALLQQIAEHPRHVLVDADRLARAAGSGRASNIVMLGASSVFLELSAADLEQAVAELLARAGERVVEVNRRAFHFGRNAALAYLDGLSRGGTSAAVRHWIEQVSPDELAAPEAPDAPIFDPTPALNRLSGAEAHAVLRTLEHVRDEGRTQLFEHEVYSIVQLVGAISPPHHVFLTPEELLSEEALNQFPGQQVVLKVVSPDIVHKTEALGVAFVRKEYDTVRAEIDRMLSRHRADADVRGILVVEFVERDQPGFGNELFVGIRATREYGPVIAAGLGGIDTEYLARKMRPGLAVAKAVASDMTAETFLELFKRTVAWEIMAGKARGHRRIVSDGELLRCFRAFISLAQRFCIAPDDDEQPALEELEVNPFSFRRQGLIPLDGRGRLGELSSARPARPTEKVDLLLEPRAIAVLGVSSQQVNFGRIILRNVVEQGFPIAHIYVIKPGADEVDGVRCVPSIAALPEPVDLLVLAAGAKHLPDLIDQVVDSGTVNAAILIPGGVGETEGSGETEALVRAAIARGRALPDGGPVFLGPNSLGAVSRPGHYDTFFIHPTKLDKRRSATPRPVALVSQSGAFIISRLSNLETLDPAFAISIGNQIDLTVSDIVRAVGKRDDVQVVGTYVEGVDELDGLELLRATREVTAAGKDVVFYKAGRTEHGRTAAAGHTAAVAGDYDISLAAAEQAGAMVAETFAEFEQLIELSTAFHRKEVHGNRVGLMSNAGFESVGMADAIKGRRYQLAVPELSDARRDRLRESLDAQGLAGLVNARNPLDLTPMANEEAYEAAVESLLDASEIDGLLVGIVPLTSALRTTPDELMAPGSLVERLPRLFAASDKPAAVVVDSGPRYEPMVRALRDAGVPVFRSADQAVRSFGHYLCHRVGLDEVRATT